MREKLRNILIQEKLLSPKGKIESIAEVHGGSINQSYLLKASGKSFFVKLNRRSDNHLFFDCEKSGLELLSQHSSFNIPKVYSIYSNSELGALIMEFVESAQAAPGFWEDFGRKLAKMHQTTSPGFGLDQDNFIGSLPQANEQRQSWCEFFMEQRIEKQYQLAREQNYLDDDFGRDLNKLYPKLTELIPEEPPALLHGDLWSGNFKVAGDGYASIFDPAVYYGHREVDLAMMHLFGGFDKRLFAAYHEIFPLEASWESRIDLFNIYPLMVHVNLFGGSYVSRARQVLRKYL